MCLQSTYITLISNFSYNYIMLLLLLFLFGGFLSSHPGT